MAEVILTSDARAIAQDRKVRGAEEKYNAAAKKVNDLYQTYGRDLTQSDPEYPTWVAVVREKEAAQASWRREADAHHRMLTGQEWK